MLSKTGILALLKDIENERVERTVSTTDTDKFAQAVCAFANDIRNSQQPGFLFIGVEDNGSLSGLHVTDNLLRNLAGLRSDGNILPSPALMVYKEEFPDGDIAVVEVQPSQIPPVRYKGKTWIRVGARKAVANEDEERILTEKRQIYSRTFDTRPCLDATLDDLEIDLFKNEYLPKAVSPEVLKQDTRSVEQQLASLRLYDKHFHCPTNAGILLLGTDPKYYIFGSYIQYVRFSGLNRASKVVKENTFSGNLIRMLKELDSFVKYTIENRRPEFVSALREKTAIDYPYLAVRELLMNAVMHRSYEGSNAPVKFYEYSNRIEIDNPGNLFGKARIENFPHENDYRNPVLAEAMKTLGYVNQFGRGISMVQETLQENGNSPAEFILNDISTFKVVLYTAYANAEENTGNQHRTKHVSGDVSGESNRINARQDKILALMNQDKYISVSTIARHIGCSARTIYRDIDCLKSKRKLLRVGDENNGYWQLLQENIENRNS